MLFVANDDGEDSTLSMVTILPRSSSLSGQRHWLDSGMAWLPSSSISIQNQNYCLSL